MKKSENAENWKATISIYVFKPAEVITVGETKTGYQNNGNLKI